MESSSRGFRVKLMFADDISNMKLPQVWFYVNPQICKTITDLKRVIHSRFRLREMPNVLQIWLQDFAIPDSECIHVIHAEDLLILRKDASCNSHPSSLLHLLGNVPQPVDANAENFLEESRQQVHHTQVESRHSVECNHPGDHLNNDLDVKDRHCNAARYMQNAVRRSEPLSSLNDSDIVSEDVGQNTIPTKPKKCKKQDKEHTVSSLIVAEGIEENIFRSKKHKRCQTDIPVVSQTPLVITESISDIEDSKTTKKPKRSRRHKRVSNVSVNVECVQESTPKVVSPLKTSVQSSSSGSRHLRFDDQYIGTCDLEGNKMEEIAVRDREFNVKCLTPNHQDSSTNNHLTHLENCQNGASEVDYTKYPQLKCQPRVNDVIAYKVLELSGNYSPEVSNFRVGQVVSFNPEENLATINFLNPISVKARTGKFEVINSDEDDDGEDTQKPRENILTSTTLEWNFVVEARLIADQNFEQN